MPQQIIIDNDGNLKVLDVGPIGPPGFTEPGVPGDEGPMGPVGPSAVTVGTLAERPDPEDFDPDQLYLAKDDDGGRLWGLSSGELIQASPSLNQAAAGKIVAQAAPETSENVTTIANTPVRVPSLTTGSFPLPPNARVTIPSLVITGHGSSTAEMRFQIRWSADGWATSNLIMSAVVKDFGTTPFYIGGTNSVGPVMLPAAGQTLLIGTEVQVGVFLLRNDVKTMTFNKMLDQGVNPYIDVRAG